MKYIAYHDESKEFGYWHGIYLVPTSTRNYLLSILQGIRNQYSYRQPIGIKNIRYINKRYYTAHAFLQAGIYSLISKSTKDNYLDYLIDLERSDFFRLIKSKFIVFRISDSHKSMYEKLDYGAKIETSFRIGLKGGCHRLGSNNDPIELTEIHFDGHQHYLRHVDKRRIISKLNNLRDYFNIDPNCKIDDCSSNHTQNNSQHYDDCQILQLTDVMIGATRMAYGYYEIQKKNSGGPNEEKKYQKKITMKESLANPMKELIFKFDEGPKRMSNSRWAHSICFSEAFIDKKNDEWIFSQIPFRSKELQRSLGF